MTLFVFVNVWLLLSIIGQILGISYNLPTFCANATWNQTALTFATSALVGTYPLGIFIDTNNTIYVADRSDNRIVIWLKGSTTPARNISGGLNGPYPLFVTDNDDVYVDNSYANYRIDKWAWNTTNSVPAMYVCSQCYGIFVDINNMLYCSMYAYHQVIYKSLTQNLNVWTTVAGVSNTAGSTSTTLNNPCAIFVDNNLNLYVADYANSRIQKFASGQLNGTTISTGAIALYHPTGVILDGGGYVFIVDNGNHRLIGSGPNGFRCIAACSGYGSSSSQLYYPQSMSFDSYGNIFVTDQYNNRIQKFLLLTNSCNETTTTTTTVATVTLMNNNQLGSLTTTAPGISSTTVGSLTNHYETECLSTHLTTFASGFIVLPAPINWSYVFANADFMKNKTVYLTMIFTSIIYIILMIFARFKDKKDFEKLGVTPLADNNKSDHYYYQILVFTGQRTNAGTDSKVYFVLSGENDQTQIRLFSDPHRKIFQRGEGSSASWFLKYVIVRDLQTLDKFYFISQQWFAVEKDDGRIERTLPVASEAEKQDFSYVLSKKGYHSVSDGHLWFSIFSRPPSNRFTRVQRCTCCFVLFFTSMLINIMYYDLSNEADASSETHSGALSIGPFYIAPQQIGIGIMVELFTLIPSLLIVQFFRRIRPRQQVSRLREALYMMKPSRKTSSEDIPAIKKKKSSITFPWWCLFIAYGLSMIIIVISIFFIIVRGIEFGDVKTQQWLTSVLTGFFSSVIFTQPIKIICLAIFFICFCRNSKDDKETSEYINDDDEFNISSDEEYLHSLEYHSLFSSQSRKSINRLNENEIAFARNQRLKEIQMWALIREFLIYFIFATLVFLINYSNREQNSFFQVNHLRAYLLNQRQTTVDYTKINTIDEYWYWLENSFVSNIRAQQWYNGDIPQYLNGFLNDKSSRLIGWATIRQLRVKSESCSDQRVILICEDSYSFSNEETELFQPGWTNQTIEDEIYSSSVIKAFNYTTSDELDTYSYIGEFGTYRGGGYVYEFRGRLSDMKTNLSKLHQLDWIDEKTRAVFIQLTLYNPNVQLLIAVTLLAEFLPTGGVYTTARFEPINFYTFTSILQLVCTILYIFFIIYFIIIEIRLLFELRLKYFYQFWSIIQLGIIGCSLGSIGVYFWRFQETNRISQLFEQTNGYIYINLQLAVYVNDILTFLLGYCCFFSTIKCFQLLRFNQQISLFAETLKYCAKALISFSIMFAVVFMSFLCLFYLLFVSKLSSCSSLLQTAQMLFKMTLIKCNASEITGADAFLGPICFILFIFLVVFVCLSMFLSIINDSFRHAKENQKENQVMLSFMLKKFLRWTGLKKLNQSEIQEERDCRMRSQYFDPIENFPDRMDQLLEALNRIYIDQKIELSRLEKAGL
ncbi:unnamed protein product [Adineta steineri]|uniref:PLAT domain-containing protein n=1 Tax=Adineta steineri TaxID=433720 RepID=A0A814RE94_9BILA|nr:unnamed protein product [Adineta steineri]